MCVSEELEATIVCRPMAKDNTVGTLQLANNHSVIPVLLSLVGGTGGQKPPFRRIATEQNLISEPK